LSLNTQRFYDSNGGSIMAKERIPSEAEIRAQIPAAIARGKAARKAGLRAQSAYYDRSADRIVMELTNGDLFGFPARRIPALARRTREELATVEVLPGGSGLHWEALDVDLSVPGLLLDAANRRELAAAFGRSAGRSRSEAKATAARANGAKGGRPRKHAA
jgi:hypothetical protein